MNKLEKFLEKWLMPVGAWISANKTLTILQNAMVSLVPITISGSIALIIMEFPYIDKVLPAGFLEQLRIALGPIVDITMGMISIYVAGAIAYYYAKQYKMSRLYTMFAAMGSLYILTPFVYQLEGMDPITGVIPTAYLGSAGMFVAILSSFLSCIVYKYLVNRNITIKMPDMVPPNIAASFTALIPMILTFLMMSLIRYGFTLSPYGDVNNLIYTILQKPLMGVGTGLLPTIFLIVLVQLFWFIGLHGQNIIYSIMGPIWIAATTANAAAYKAGEDLQYIVTDEFFSFYICPSFLALIIALLLFGRKGTAHREIAKAALPSGLFNISEPIVFGLPVVMNVLTVIPWVLVMTAGVLISYGSMSLGIVPKPIGAAIPWTTPPLLSGFLITNSVRGALLQIFNIAVGIAIWLPFIKILNKQAENSGEVRDVL